MNNNRLVDFVAKVFNVRKKMNRKFKEKTNAIFMHEKS